MEQYEKIIELLEKEKLTRDEQNYLSEIVKSDNDAARIVSVYNGIRNNLPNLMHVDAEMIGDFILHENGELPDESVIPVLADKIKLHLRSCLKCQEEYRTLKDEFNEVVNHIDKSIVEEKRPSNTKSVSSIFSISKFPSFKYAFAAIAVIAVTYLSLFTISSVSTPDYYKNIFSEKNDDFYVTRGRTSVSFQKGLDAVQKGSYDDAIEYFERDIEEYSEQSSIFYTHFITGLTYFKAAESSIIGLFKSFDKNKVNLAIVNLNLSIEKNISGNYENLSLDAHYYLGRAYLLLNNVKEAKEQLSIVIESKGKFYNEASELISKLNKN